MLTGTFVVQCWSSMTTHWRLSGRSKWRYSEPAEACDAFVHSWWSSGCLCDLWCICASAWSWLQDASLGVVVASKILSAAMHHKPSAYLPQLVSAAALPGVDSAKQSVPPSRTMLSPPSPLRVPATLSLSQHTGPALPSDASPTSHVYEVEGRALRQRAQQAVILEEDRDEDGGGVTENTGAGGDGDGGGGGGESKREERRSPPVLQVWSGPDVPAMQPRERRESSEYVAVDDREYADGAGEGAFMSPDEALREAVAGIGALLTERASNSRSSVAQSIALDKLVEKHWGELRNVTVQMPEGRDVNMVSKRSWHLHVKSVVLAVVEKYRSSDHAVPGKL